MTVAVAAGLEWFHVVAMLATGTLAGLLGGLLGIGGGLVMIPAMYLILSDSYGLDSFHLYKLAAITTSIVVSIPAAIRHARVRALVYPLLFSIVPLALLGVIVGVWLASWFADEYTHLLRRTFGGFIILVVVVNVYRARRAAAGDARLGETCPSPRRWGLIGWLVGFPAGVIAGLLGVGGGVWAVPSQNIALGVRLRNAIANSSFMIAFVAPMTAVSLCVSIRRSMPSLQVSDGLWLALCLAPGALLGGWCGAGLVHRLPVGVLRQTFHVLLVVTGLRLMIW